jgi:hypothetical protein
MKCGAEQSRAIARLRWRARRLGLRVEKLRRRVVNDRSSDWRLISISGGFVIVGVVGVTVEEIERELDVLDRRSMGLCE